MATRHNRVNKTKYDCTLVEFGESEARLSNGSKSTKYLIGMPAPGSLGGPISSEPPFVEALREKGLNVITDVYVYGEKLRPTGFFSRASRVVRTAPRFRRLIG